MTCILWISKWARTYVSVVLTSLTYRVCFVIDYSSIWWMFYAMFKTAPDESNYAKIMHFYTFFEQNAKIQTWHSMYAIHQMRNGIANAWCLMTNQKGKVHTRRRGEVGTIARIAYNVDKPSQAMEIHGFKSFTPLAMVTTIKRQVCMQRWTHRPLAMLKTAFTRWLVYLTH